MSSSLSILVLSAVRLLAKLGFLKDPSELTFALSNSATFDFCNSNAFLACSLKSRGNSLILSGVILSSPYLCLKCSLTSLSALNDCKSRERSFIIRSISRASFGFASLSCFNKSNSASLSLVSASTNLRVLTFSPLRYSSLNTLEYLSLSLASVSSAANRFTL